MIEIIIIFTVIIVVLGAISLYLVYVIEQQQKELGEFRKLIKVLNKL